MSNWSSNCSNFTAEYLRSLNLGRTVTSFVCLIVISLTIAFLVFYKAFKSTLQRLFLYLSLVTFFQELSHVLQVERLFQYPVQDRFCSYLGLFITWTGSMVYLFTFVITVFLLCTVYRQVHGAGRLYKSLEASRSCRVALEGSTAIFVLCFPLTYLWVPLIHGNFGESGAWCWMRTIDQETCKDVGFKDQLTFVYSLVIGVNTFNLTAMLALAIVFCKLAAKYRQIRHTHLQKVKETLTLMAFLITSIVLDSSEIAVRLYTGIAHRHAFPGLWMAYAIGPPIALLAFPLGFLVYLYSIRKLSRTSITKMAREWSCSCCSNCFPQSSGKRGRKYHRHHHHHREGEEDTDEPSAQAITFHASTAATDPSHTFFSPPRTNGFSELEDDQLMSFIDTGYGSV